MIAIKLFYKGEIMNNERLIKKIKSLFALAANDSATGNESENALRMAEGLLRKHSIELFDLRDKESVGVSFHDFKKQWEKVIYMAVCELYNCRVITDNSWDKPKMVIVGTESNRITAEIVIKQLISQILKDSKGEKEAFRNGAANGLYYVCNDIVKARQTEKVEAIPGTGIMALDLDNKFGQDNEDWLSKHIPNLSKGKARRKRVDQRGLDYGSRLNPGARVGSSQLRLS